MRFGEYLVKRRKVSEEQIAEALRYQETHVQTPIGEIACAAEKLTPEQVSAVLREQALSQRPFGELAVEHSYVSSEEMLGLLWAQGEKRRHIGDLLVEIGALDRAGLKRELLRYERATVPALLS